MNIYETKWLRAQFPDPWRIQTTRDKIIFMPLSQTSTDAFELMCLKKDIGESTDEDLRQDAASFETQGAQRETIKAGSLQGFCLTIKGREKRYFLRYAQYIVMCVIRPDSADTDFQTEARKVIENLHLKRVEPAAGDYRLEDKAKSQR